MRRPFRPTVPTFALLALACLACSGLPVEQDLQAYPGATRPGADRQPAANDPRFGEIYPGRPPARVEGSRDATHRKIREHRGAYRDMARDRERLRRMQEGGRQHELRPPQPRKALPTLSVSFEGAACDIDADCLVATLSPCGDDPAALNIGYHQLIGAELAELHDEAPAICDAIVPTPEATCRDGYCQLASDNVQPWGWSVREPDDHGGYRYAMAGPQQLDRWWGGEQQVPFAPRLASPPPPPPALVDGAREWHRWVDRWIYVGTARRALEAELAEVNDALRDQVTAELQTQRGLLLEQLEEVPAPRLPPPPTPPDEGLACDQAADCTALPPVPCDAAPLAANASWADAVKGRSRRLQEALACERLDVPTAECTDGYCRLEGTPFPHGRPARVPDGAGGFRYQDESLRAAERRWEDTLARWDGPDE